MLEVQYLIYHIENLMIHKSYPIPLALSPNHNPLFDVKLRHADCHCILFEGMMPYLEIVRGCSRSTVGEASLIVILFLSCWLTSPEEDKIPLVDSNLM